MERQSHGCRHSAEAWVACLPTYQAACRHRPAGGHAGHNQRPLQIESTPKGGHATDFHRGFLAAEGGGPKGRERASHCRGRAAEEVGRWGARWRGEAADRAALWPCLA